MTGGAIALGVDVGGTKTTAALVTTHDGRRVARVSGPTDPGRGGEAVLERAVSLASEVASRTAGPIVGIGVAVAELVDPQGRVSSGATIGWERLDVRAAFSGISPTVVVESDVRAGALAEARLGAGRDADPFVFVSVGTGISSALVLGGRPHAGARGNAIVLASAALSTTCPHCGEESAQSLEEIASGPALVRGYEDRTGRRVDGALEVTDAAIGGDPDAREVLRQGGRALGVAVAFLVNVLDPVAVVVGGGLGLAVGPYRDAFVPALREHVWAPATRDLDVRPALLGPDAQVVGAALRAADAAAPT